MQRRAAIIMLLALALTGCSYDYRVLAVERDGQLTFIVDPAGNRHPSCLRLVEVTADRTNSAKPDAGDDTSRVGYGTFWFESVSHEDGCANTFPLIYGVKLRGRHQTEIGVVKAKPLLRNVVYEVSTTTGATGYGSGRFVVHTDGKVENIRGN